MSGIRVLLACPRLKTLDVWKFLLAQEPAIEVVGEAEDPVDILLSAGSTQADVVVIDLPTAERDPGLHSHLLAEYPQLKVIGVSSEGDSTVVYSIGIVRREAQEISLQTVTNLIRTLSEQHL